MCHINIVPHVKSVLCHVSSQYDTENQSWIRETIS